MSDTILKTLSKIISENVLSGDFKVANFKSKLKEFLKFVANTFSFLNPKENQPLIDKAVETACAKLVASKFDKIKLPKASRLYLAAVYAVRVLGQEFPSKEDIRTHLIARYGSSLVFASDTMELGK